MLHASLVFRGTTELARKISSSPLGRNHGIGLWRSETVLSLAAKVSGRWSSIPSRREYHSRKKYYDDEPVKTRESQVGNAVAKFRDMFKDFRACRIAPPEYNVLAHLNHPPSRDVRIITPKVISSSEVQRVLERFGKLTEFQPLARPCPTYPPGVFALRFATFETSEAAAELIRRSWRCNLRIGNAPFIASFAVPKYVVTRGYEYPPSSSIGIQGFGEDITIDDIRRRFSIYGALSYVDMRRNSRKCLVRFRTQEFTDRVASEIRRFGLLIFLRPIVVVVTVRRRHLIIGRLPEWVTEQQLREAFIRYGDGTDARIVEGRTRGAVIEFVEKESAIRAMKDHEQKHIQLGGKLISMRYRLKVREDGIQTNTLRVHGYPTKATVSDLRNVFRPYGKLVDIMEEYFQWRPTGTAQIIYDSVEAAAKAREAHRQKPLTVYGQEIMLDFLREGSDRPIFPPRTYYKQREPNHIIHITNLPTEVTMEEITDLFSPFGEIEFVYMYPAVGGSTVYGYVHFKEQAAAVKAIEILRRAPIRMGRRLVTIRFSRPHTAKYDEWRKEDHRHPHF